MRIGRDHLITADRRVNVVTYRKGDEYFVGDVDGTPFRFKLANLTTAISEREKAARALAAWTAIVNDMS